MSERARGLHSGMSIRGGGAGYQIHRATGVCAASGRAIVGGETYIATLSEEGDEFRRRDYAIEAWEAGARGAMLAFWRTTMREGEHARRGLIAGDELMDVFEQLEGTEDPSRQAFRYVLTLILIRKKLLVYEGTREGVLLVRARGVAGGVAGAPEGAELRRVLDPGMDEARVAEVAAQLGQIIDEDES